MDTVEYIKQNLMKELALKSNSISINDLPTLDYLRLTVSWTIPAAAIAYNPTASTLTSLYNKRATSKNHQVSRIDWNSLQTADSADKVLKYLLELHCHVYNNDEHTRYYDPTAQLTPVQAPVRAPKPVYRQSNPQPQPRYSTKPDIAKLVEEQIEFDKQWEEAHRHVI